MSAATARRDVHLEASSIDDVASLRQNVGVTVRISVLRNQLLQEKVDSRSKKSCQPHSNFSCFSEQREYRFVSSRQPSKKQNPQACESACSGLCSFNYTKLESLISCKIQQRLSSSMFFSKRLFPPLLSRKCFGYFFILIAVFLSSQPSLTDALPSSMSKAPLTKTDATKLNYELRQFNGLGPNSRKARTRNGIPHRLSSPLVSSGPKNPIDFQTMKVIKQWGDSTFDVLLVSGKDYIYMINSTSTSTEREIRYIERLKWASTGDFQRACRQMGKQKHECNNFIRVVELQNDGRLYVCGTNSYAPKCRYYTRGNFSSPGFNADSQFTNEMVCHGQCECPYNPATSSANLYTNTSAGFQLFSAVINDFMGKKPVLMRKANPYVYSVERWFNDPTFIKMVEHSDGKVYLFFRETATAVETGNSPATYARVAQVCKEDMGGDTVLRYQWTTFLKARLKCSIPGSSHGLGFDFDNLTSVSDVVRITTPHGPMDAIFATFTTPWEWSVVSMSAVCVYYMDTIKKQFEVGNFLGEQELHSGPVTSESAFDLVNPVETVVKAIPVPPENVPIPRPGKCSDPSSSINDQTLYFAKDHFLMFDPVMPLYQQPMYVGESDVRATQIAVDSNAGDSQALVVYVGTEDGKILRLRPRLQIASGPKSILLEEIRIAKEQDCTSGRSPCGVLALHISHPPDNVKDCASLNSSLFVAFTDRMVQLPLTKCQQYGNEKCCSVDPNCGWLEGKCIIRTSQNKRNLSETSDMVDIPTNCQIQFPPERSEQGCTPGEGGRETKGNSPSPTTNGCQSNDSGSDGRAENLQDRPAITGDQLVNDQPGETASATGTQDIAAKLRNTPKNAQDRAIRVSIPPRGTQNIATPGGTTPCREEDGATSSRRNANFPPVDAAISHLFAKHILPPVFEEFNETYTNLGEEEREALMEQLRVALARTTSLVLRNHKQEYCLPLPSINSLTHSYPLLLHKIEIWHGIALKKMTEKGFRRACWGENRSQLCTAKVTVTDSFSPTLWEPFTRLITEFGATCDPVPNLAPNSTCSNLAGVLTCTDETNPLCRSKQCRFTKYAVDVKAFFRHVNDSRKFLSSRKLLEPLWKPVNVTITAQNQVKGHLELVVSDNPTRPSESQRFKISYNPITEKITISFYYVPVRDCSLDEGECAGSTHGCNPKLERVLSLWLRAITAGLKPRVKTCRNQIKRFNKENRVVSPDRRHSRHRRSRSRFEVTDNNIRQSIPTNCRYVKIKAKFPSLLWDQLTHRGERRGGHYSNINERIEFYSRESIEQFFENQCSSTGLDGELVRLGKRFQKKKRIINVEAWTTQGMPFVIEKQSPKKVKMKFFSKVVE